jgi:methylated-DNA-[protein]-cysteine S-methyltransferase
MRVTICTVKSPIGQVVVSWLDDSGVVSVDYDLGVEELERRLSRRLGPVDLATARRHPAGTAMAAYFRGDLHAIDELPVTAGGTPFQRSVWKELRRIPVGETVTYSELARRVGRPGSVRAVGGANGDNPINVVVPCHRVIGKDGSLTGYGGGIERKRWLLRHEGALE